MPKRPAKKSKAATRKAPSKAAKKAPAPKAAKKSSGKKSAKKSSAARAAKAGDDRLAHLQQLIELMVEREVVEVELEEAGTRWRVRRTDPNAVTYAAPPMPVAGAATAPLPAALATPAAGAPAAAGPVAPAEPEGEVFPSPMVGTFYRAASPDSDPFVKAGDQVSADTTVCIIEAMKVMNEIKAEREFEIVEVLVKNGDPIEFGQPLFLIR
jgi:acetyl-CoA carboxylase biotin carboxyl carrier protein